MDVGKLASELQKKEILLFKVKWVLYGIVREGLVLKKRIGLFRR
jgi:hypothetical protein